MHPRVGLLAVMPLLAAGCSSSPTAGPGATSPSPGIATRPARAVSRSSPTPPKTRMVVAVRTITVVDRAAGTPARGPAPARQDRVLTTFVWYPAAAGGGGVALPGPYPLVVFAHGFDSTPRVYAGLLRYIAAAGYVVAAPRFPISASDLPGPPSEDDIGNQALDVRATITTLLGMSARHGWLAGRLNRHEVAVAGHSDGAETVVGNLLVSGYHDRRIKAAVVVAGQPPGGRVAPLAIPTLVVQGSADTINPPGLSHDLYALLPSPKWYLDVIGATHPSVVLGTGRRARVVRRIVVAFLDAALRHDPWARVATAAMRYAPLVRLRAN